MIAKWLFQNVVCIAGFGALLFGSAGTLHWPAAWIFLLFMALIGFGFGAWLARTNPGLLEERMRAPIRADQPAADKTVVFAFGALALIFFVTIGLDQRFHGSQMGIAWRIAGLVLLTLSSFFIAWVFNENTFASAVVRLQSERGHQVISSGPYAWVRHPMYTGAVMFMIGVALLLGSWWGTAMSPIFAVLFGIRIGIEERTLRTGLPGYPDYAARVRYRLVPGLW